MKDINLGQLVFVLSISIAFGIAVYNLMVKTLDTIGELFYYAVGWRVKYLFIQWRINKAHLKESCK